jgi:hypothetical protein
LPKTPGFQKKRKKHSFYVILHHITDCTFSKSTIKHSLPEPTHPEELSTIGKWSDDKTLGYIHCNCSIL